jgi:hypothetical protein
MPPKRKAGKMCETQKRISSRTTISRFTNTTLVKAPPRTNDNRIACDVTLNEQLLLRPVKRAKTEFWDYNIIGERRDKTDRHTVDYLVEARPVWRRGKLGTDIWHRDRWEAFKEIGGTCTTANEEYNPIYLHRQHPLLHESRFDVKDRHAARIMLGRMLKNVMDNRQHLGGEVAGILIASQIHEKPEGVAPLYILEEAALHGQRFFDSYGEKQRRKFGKNLIRKSWSALIQHPYIGGLAIALVSESAMMHYLRKKRQPNKTVTYRNAVDRFLHAYHSGYHKEHSYAELLHIYYVLQGMLLGNDVPAVTRLIHIDAPPPPRSSSPRMPSLSEQYERVDERDEYTSGQDVAEWQEEQDGEHKMETGDGPRVFREGREDTHEALSWDKGGGCVHSTPRE